MNEQKANNKFVEGYCIIKHVQLSVTVLSKWWEHKNVLFHNTLITHDKNELSNGESKQLAYQLNLLSFCKVLVQLDQRTQRWDQPDFLQRQE